MSDHWRDGWSLAVDLRMSRLAREAVLQLDGPLWPAAKLEGFLFAHEQILAAQRCTCSSCPIHRDAEMLEMGIAFN